MPDPTDDDKRLAALEAAVASSVTTQRLGLLISLTFLGLSIYDHLTRPDVRDLLRERLDD